MSKLTNDDNATATPCHYDNASCKKRKRKIRKTTRNREQKKEIRKSLCYFVWFCVTKWTGKATNTLFFITDGIIIETWAGCK